MGTYGQLTREMILYYAGDARRINHFLKVCGFAKAIGELEGLDAYTQDIVEIAALTHDIGIKQSEIKYKSSAGQYQQAEGPPEAEKMLSRLGVDRPVIDRVCWLIAHHHTYTDIRDMDHQILVEADFLVNIHEDDMSPDAIRSVHDKVFKTESGKGILRALYQF